MRLNAVTLLPLAALFLAVQTSRSAPGTIPELRRQLAAHLAEPRFAAAQWGVKVVSLETGKTIFEENAGKLLSPASNTKLFSCALALDRLGVDHQIKTSLYATNQPDTAGVLHSDLIVYGRGDPSFTSRRDGGDIHHALAPLVRALTNAGVRAIEGDLIGDDSFLPGPPLGSGWDWDDAQHAYGAELSALSINDNVLAVFVRPGSAAGLPAPLYLEPTIGLVQVVNQVRTAARNEARRLTLDRPPGGNLMFVSGQIPLGDPGVTNFITVHNPAGLFAALFRQTLETVGIKVAGIPRTVNWRDRQQRPIPWEQWIELGSVGSPPMREIVGDTLKQSRNLSAALLLEYVGVQQSATNSMESAEARGVRSLNLFLKQAGIREAEFYFSEGSGLSRDNLVTANAVVRLLDFMSRHAAAGAFTNALPIAGVDGTLEKRMTGTPAGKNVRAKTGALRWANSLSGYVTTATGERLAFAIFLNRYRETEPGPPARQELDTIAVWLAALRQHSREWKP